MVEVVSARILSLGNVQTTAVECSRFGLGLRKVCITVRLQESFIYR